MTMGIREKAIKTEIKLKKKLYSRISEYTFSNDLFENWIKDSLNINSVWIDAGCGSNSIIYEFENLAPKGIGIDEVTHPEILTSNGKFIKSNLENIPFEDNSVDIITANMVVEHIVNIDKVLMEFHRILKTGGKFIFRTTNKNYPTLFLGNLLPKKLKDIIIYRIFGIKSHDIFATTYPINTIKKINKVFTSRGFKIDKLVATEDLHMFNPIVFEISYQFYKLQRLKIFRNLRNNIVCSVSKL